MLSILGFAMVLTFLLLIMTKRLSPFIGLTLVPIIFGLIGGFGAELGPLIMEGILKCSTYRLSLIICHPVFWNHVRYRPI